MFLFVDRIKDVSSVLGPGKRAVVWFHGCRRNCPGCIAASMNVSESFTAFTPNELLEYILKIKGVEGITITGGEPFDQNCESLDVVLAAIKSTGLSVMAYTGYHLEEIERDSDKNKLLKYIDILVDGPYMEDQNHGEKWRGSANQRIHFLTDVYSKFANIVEKEKMRLLEFEFGDGLEFSFTGIPPIGFRDRLIERFNQKGFEIKW